MGDGEDAKTLATIEALTREFTRWECSGAIS
jgi:hypothetical protein